MNEIALVYMVAGLSKRFGGKPKWIAKVGPKGESFIEHSLNQAIPAGFTKMILIVSDKTKLLFKDIFGDNYKSIPIHYAMQTFDIKKRDKPWGTLDALVSAKRFLDCPYVICSGDDLYGKEAYKILADHLMSYKTNATVGYKLKYVLSKKGSVNRGTFKIDKNSNVSAIKEVFNITTENFVEKGLNENTQCSMLFFGLQPETVDILSDVLKKFQERNKENRTSECLLPNELGTLIEQHKIKMKAYPTDERWYGITNPEDEEFVRTQIKEMNN